MILGAVEIDSGSTRLLVSDVRSRASRILVDREHRLTARLESVERLGALLMAEIELARDAGAERVDVLAAPGLRGSRLIRLAERFADAAGAGPIRIPDRRERVAAAFLGAGRPRSADPGRRLAVATIDEDAVGIAVGAPGGQPGWIGSRPVGAATMTRKARFHDPPLPGQIEAAISGARRSIASLSPPATGRLLVSTELAAVVARLCGERPDASGARRGLGRILGQTASDISAWFGLGPASARRLPGILVGHVALAEGLGCGLEPVRCDPIAGRRWLAEAAIETGAAR